jgi:hypothetical protein
MTPVRRTGTLDDMRRLISVLAPLAMILVAACSSAPAVPAGRA